MGTPDSAVPSLQRLVEQGNDIVVWTQPDRPSGRGHKLTISPVKQFALSRNLAVHQPSKIRTKESIELFASHNADLAVVVAYGRILPAPFLQAPKKGCVNVHFSLLPLHRGAAPVNWALINGDVETGATTMLIEEKLDAGPILLQRETSIAEAETATQLMSRLAILGAELLAETLQRFDSITPRPQDDTAATFAPMLKKEDGLINWTIDAVAIERRIRGFQPWPTAYTHYNSNRLITWHATPVNNVSRSAHPGEIIAARGDELVVSCGENTSLLLKEVQPEGKRRMSVREFINGTHLRVGDKFE